MSTNVGGVAVIIGILILGMALFVPSLVDVTQNDAKETLSLDNQSNQELTDKLSVTVDDVVDGSNATLTLTDDTTLETNSTTVDVGNESTLALSGDNITVGVESVDTDSAQFNATYPPMFGWDSAPRTFMQNTEIIFILLAFLIAVSLAVKVV